MGWLTTIGATSGECLDDVPAVVASGRIGNLPVEIIAPLPWAVAGGLGRQWTVDQLRELIDAPPIGGAR